MSAPIEALSALLSHDVPVAWRVAHDGAAWSPDLDLTGISDTDASQILSAARGASSVSSVPSSGDSSTLWDAEGTVCARVARPVAVCVADRGSAGSAAWETAATLLRARTRYVTWLE